MKKAILLIAALLVCGSLAFADYSIGCWGRTVFNMAGGSSAANSQVSLGWGPNWGGQDLTRMGVTLSFSSSSLSFKITEYFNGAPTSGNSNFDLVNMYGSCKVIPDMLTVIVGRVRGDGFDDFRGNGPNPNSDQNNNLGRMAGWGLWIVFQPKDLGLEIAVNMMTPPPGTQPGYNVHWEIGGGFATPYRWEQQLHNINVAGSYTIPDIARITLAFMNQCVGDNTVFVSDWTANESLYEIYGRVDLLAITGMTLYVDGAYTGFELTRLQNLQLDLGFGYKIGDLGLYLVGKFNLPLETAGGDPSVAANLEVTYGLKPITLGLIVGTNISFTPGSNMQIAFQPYVTLDDVSLRISFNYQLNTDGVTDNTWNVPIHFTFSF